jgi:hypothetical protein
MQIQNRVPSFTPRSLGNGPQGPQPPQDPQEPKGGLEFDNDSFGERFVSNYIDTTGKTTGFLYPMALGFAGNRLGSMVGTMALGPVGGLVGGLCGSIVGYGYGRKTQPTVEGKVDDVSGNNKAQQFLVKTLYTGALGAGVLGAFAGFAPGPMALGAGIAVGGTALYSAYQSK